MGFLEGGIFANDHNLDVLDRLRHELEQQIDEGVSAEEEATSAADQEDGYALLVSLDEHVLAPIALLAALCSDPVVHAYKPDEVEIGRWYEVVQKRYRQVQRLEKQYPPRPAGSMLYGSLPGREPSPVFWLERERETDEMFQRLLEVPE